MWVKAFFVCILVFSFVLPCTAETDVGLGDMISSLPDGIYELLPDEFLDGSTQGAAEGINKLLDGKYFAELFRGLFFGGLEAAVPTLLSVFTLLVAAALLAAFKDCLRSDALSGAVSLASSAVLSALCVRGAAAHIEAVELFLERLSQLCLAMLPVMGTVLAMGGSGGAAVATSGGVLMILGVMEAVVGEAFGSIVGISLALSVANIFSSKFRLSAVARAVRRGFGVFFGVVMSLLCFIVSLKIGIASAGDSMAMRGARLFAQNAIPLVGSAIGSTFGTLATSLSYIKSVSGTAGAVFVLLLALPVFIKVWAYRCGLVLLSGAAEMLGCDRERELLTGVVSIYGYMLAIIAVSAAVFLIILTLFTQTALAFGGGI